MGAYKVRMYGIVLGRPLRPVCMDKEQESGGKTVYRRMELIWTKCLTDKPRKE